MQNTDSTPAPSPRLRRRLASTLLAVCVFTGIIVGTARPAHAATWVTGCFVMSDGYLPTNPYRVELWTWVDGLGWQVHNSGRLNANGCISLHTRLGYYYNTSILVVNDHNFGGLFWGWSGIYAELGPNPAGVGWGVIQYFGQ